MEKAASSSTLLKPLYTYVWDTVKGKNPNDDILCFTNMLRLGFPLQHSPSQTRNAQYIFFIFTIFKLYWDSRRILVFRGLAASQFYAEMGGIPQ